MALDCSNPLAVNKALFEKPVGLGVMPSTFHARSVESMDICTPYGGPQSIHIHMVALLEDAISFNDQHLSLLFPAFCNDVTKVLVRDARQRGDTSTSTN